MGRRGRRYVMEEEGEALLFGPELSGRRIGLGELLSVSSREEMGVRGRCGQSRVSRQIEGVRALVKASQLQPCASYAN